MSTHLRVAFTGTSGLIGRSLAWRLNMANHQLCPLVRTQPVAEGSRFWDYDQGILEGGFDDCDAVVHLGGETIDGHWTPIKKRRIRESRVLGTRFLANQILAAEKRPQVFIQASAVGFYGHRRAEVVDEASVPGSGFLAEVVQEWEQASAELEAAGVRVVRLRFGVVLSAKGGVLKKMLPVFRLALGGPLGDGDQRMSWISLPDAVEVIRLALLEDDWQGTYNVVAPEFVTNARFAKTLGRVLRRPALLPVPTTMLHLSFGEMADATILSDVAVRPSRLLERNHPFQHPKLETALTSLLR